LNEDLRAELHTLYLAKGVHGTTAIEGNTLTEEQVKSLIEGKLKLPPSQQYLALEAQNIVDACNRTVRTVAEGGTPSITPELLMSLNRQVLDGLALEEGVIPGEIRTHSVLVGNVYRGAPAEDCEHLLRKLCEWLNSAEFKATELGVGSAIIRAILAHLYLAWIHPFGDGNGRTARLVEFLILVNSGIPTSAGHLLSNHYNRTKSAYLRELHESSKAPYATPARFLLYALEGFVDGVREALELIREFQFRLAWREYVHQHFPTRSSPTEQRRRSLVLDLSDAGRAVPKNELRRMTPQIAELYARSGDKTLTRDVNAVIEQGLIRRSPEGLVANREIILAFLPLKSTTEDHSE